MEEQPVSYEEFLRCKYEFERYLKDIGKYEKTRQGIIYSMFEKSFSTFSTVKNKNESDEKDIRKLYKKLILKYHPDKGGDSEIFIQIQNAYERRDIETLNIIDNCQMIGTNNTCFKMGDGFSDVWKRTDAYKWVHNIDRETVESFYMTMEEAINFYKITLGILTRPLAPEIIRDNLFKLSYKWHLVKDIVSMSDPSTISGEAINKIISLINS